MQTHWIISVIPLLLRPRPLLTVCVCVYVFVVQAQLPTPTTEIYFSRESKEEGKKEKEKSGLSFFKDFEHITLSSVKANEVSGLSAPCQWWSATTNMFKCQTQICSSSLWWDTIRGTDDSSSHHQVYILIMWIFYLLFLFLPSNILKY